MTVPCRDVMVLLAATETNLSRVIPCDEVDVHPA